MVKFRKTIKKSRKNSSLFLLKLCIPQEIFLNLCEGRAGKFLITIEGFAFLAHNFLPVANFLLPNFWYDKISKMSPLVKQWVVKTGGRALQKGKFCFIKFRCNYDETWSANRFWQKEEFTINFIVFT